MREGLKNIAKKRLTSLVLLVKIYSSGIPSSSLVMFFRCSVLMLFIIEATKDRAPKIIRMKTTSDPIISFVLVICTNIVLPYKI